jgi:hypothetical protein
MVGHSLRTYWEYKKLKTKEKTKKETWTRDE